VRTEGGQYLQVRPYDSVWMWGSHPRYAALMTRTTAEGMAALLRESRVGDAPPSPDAHASEDYHQRQPELDPVCLTKHWWYYVRPRVLKCKRCGALKTAER
jgi:hypothetical protein